MIRMALKILFEKPLLSDLANLNILLIWISRVLSIDWRWLTMNIIMRRSVTHWLVNYILITTKVNNSWAWRSFADGWQIRRCAFIVNGWNITSLRLHSHSDILVGGGRRNIPLITRRVCCSNDISSFNKMWLTDSRVYSTVCNVIWISILQIWTLQIDNLSRIKHKNKFLLNTT